MRNYSKHLAAFTFLMLFATSAHCITWISFDYPGAKQTIIQDIGADNNVVGKYMAADGSYHNFLYDGTNWTTLDFSRASGTVFAVDGTNIVGTYGLDHSSGFIFDGTTWNTLDFPGADRTFISDIQGNSIVGSYSLGSVNHGFLYNGTSWTTLDFPGADSTVINGIDNDNIVGLMTKNGILQNFLYDGMTWIIFDWDSAISLSIDGDNIVGSTSSYSVLYNLDSQILTILADYPGSRYTAINGIDGNKIVGGYIDMYGNIHGFIATIPEPATALLFTFGCLIARKHKTAWK